MEDNGRVTVDPIVPILWFGGVCVDFSNSSPALDAQNCRNAAAELCHVAEKLYEVTGPGSPNV